MTPADIEALAARCEAATGPDRELDYAIVEATLTAENELLAVIYGRVHIGTAPKWTASLDAAMTLVPEGWFISRLNDNPHMDRSHVLLVTNGYPFAEAEGHGATRMLALCAAALRARAKEQV